MYSSGRQMGAVVGKVCVCTTMICNGASLAIFDLGLLFCSVLHLTFWSICFGLCIIWIL